VTHVGFSVLQLTVVRAF